MISGAAQAQELPARPGLGAASGRPGDGPARAQAFLRRLAEGGVLPADRIAVVVAHPDDETIGIGAQLPRLPGIAVMTVTDGAPRNGEDARRHGFPTPEAYAAARRRELETAMALAGVPANRLIGFGVPDQEAALRLPEIARELAGLFAARGIDTVVTHAYEGGHPDHDAVAFAVHAAARLRGDGAPALVEMPLYHLGPDGWAVQRFLDPEAPALAVRLAPDERALKERMIAAHVTQAGVLAAFPPEIERFRSAPSYDFSVLPNDGRLLYEHHGWGMTGARWRDLVQDAERELGFGPR